MLAKYFWLIALILVGLCCQCNPSTPQGSAGEAVIESDLIDPLDLGHQAKKVKKGMKREQVFALLGKPTWASIAGDRGDYGVRDPETEFILFWRNPGLAVVEVRFGKDGSVQWDGGIPVAASAYAHMFEPSASFSCERADRKQYCQ